MTGLNKMCSFAWNIGLWPLVAIVSKINPTSWRFEGNPLKIDGNIAQNVQFYLKHRVVTPCCDRLKNLTLLCEALKAIY